jgi:hypothetical protein
MRVVWSLLLSVVSSFPMSPLESRLDRQMKTWQKRLGLEDWSLTLRVVRQWQMDPDAWGTSEWDPDAKTGVINVLDPRDYNLKGSELRRDMECTIVHELVHIQVSPVTAHTDGEVEDVVTRMTAALMNRPCPN